METSPVNTTQAKPYDHEKKATPMFSSRIGHLTLLLDSRADVHPKEVCPRSSLEDKLVQGVYRTPMHIQVAYRSTWRSLPLLQC